ncbi:MBL fold metallo-hydrolase [Hyperthermus butylicus]|uniref:Ribonuclease Z n=1 Tax=Hyperthermus butylicus (strain DSM 5456 / JCM 9403 / PLM1-5) TaxID=415426 RepID=A2BJD4_HYPBU|nr:MBL fold metallo-hydrolase [Hyperthermus butylicus]ABM80095.1 ribonuclease Z [Hyperthermus butylicus DSM 5456]
MIWFIGTAGAGGVPGRAKNCILVDTGDARLLLDVGPGCVERLYELGYSACDVDYIYISHLHMDHWSGLFDYAVRYSVEGCSQPPTLLAGEKVRDQLSSVIETLPGRLRGEVGARSIPASGGLELDGMLIRVYEAVHTLPAYTVEVIVDGSTLVYSGDTGPTGKLRELASRTDLLVVEASMPRGMEVKARETGHHTVDEAAAYRDQMRSEALLVLTHLTRESLEDIRRHGLPRRVIAASDGLVLSI